ncbi:MAG: hypothetical protein IPM48_15055 [Saprospiraceae bacterium]|nr:hypothetical protein [Saprospiraceae bacterium]
MTREISLHKTVVDKWIPEQGLTKIMLYDPKRRTVYSVTVEEAKKHWNLKRVGQESQYYFPIEILKKKENVELNV